MHASVDVDIPRYAGAIVAADEIVDLLSFRASLLLYGGRL